MLQGPKKYQICRSSKPHILGSKKSAKSTAVVNPSYYLGPELYPRIARRQQRTAPFSDSRGGRPCLDFDDRKSAQLYILQLPYFILFQVAEQIWICENQTVTKWEGDILSYKDHLKSKVMKEANKDAKKKGLDKDMRGNWQMINCLLCKSFHICYAKK